MACDYDRIELKSSIKEFDYGDIISNYERYEDSIVDIVTFKQMNESINIDLYEIEVSTDYKGSVAKGFFILGVCKDSLDNYAVAKNIDEDQEDFKNLPKNIKMEMFYLMGDYRKQANFDMFHKAKEKEYFQKLIMQKLEVFGGSTKELEEINQIPEEITKEFVKKNQANKNKNIRSNRRNGKRRQTF